VRLLSPSGEYPVNRRVSFLSNLPRVFPRLALRNGQADSIAERLTVIDPKRCTRIGWREILSNTDLIWFLIRRDISVRYKQTAVGLGWAVVKPLVSMIVFTIFLGYVAKFPSEGIPYPAFYFCGLVIWAYVSTAVVIGSESFVSDSSLISKIYIPRILIPLSPVISGLFDLLISIVVLVLMVLYYCVPITAKILLLPVFLLPCVLTAAAIGILFAPLAAKFRDFISIVNLMSQVWMFASPLIYPTSLVPERFRILYSLNPLVGPMEGVRWIFFGTGPYPWEMFLVGTITAVLLLAFSLGVFRWAVGRVADYI